MADVNVITAIISIIAGIAFGAFWAWFGYIKENDVFDSKKFTIGVITGAIAGLGAAVLNLTGIVNAADFVAQLTAFVGLFFIVGGVDKFRSNASGAIANRAVNEEPQ